MTRAEILAIDGPSGVGKSSVSSSVAAALGARRLDTGAMYRAVTAAALRAGTDPSDARGVTKVAELGNVAFHQDSRVILDGTDITEEIRGTAVTAAVSTVSAHPGVRRALVAQQRRIASSGTWVVDGRDVGTVVFPNAALKVFLTASIDERARRRTTQAGDTDLAAQKADIERRDRLDSSRSDSPLCPAADAVVIDTTDMSLAGVVDQVLRIWRSR